MPAEVRFTRNFEDNLDTIREFLLSTSPSQAVERFALLQRQIVSVALLLSEHPRIGRPMRTPSHPSRRTKLALNHLAARTRSLRAGELREYLLQDYVVLYAATQDMVHLLAIKHQKQLLYTL